jgi:hypothetical protein
MFKAFAQYWLLRSQSLMAQRPTRLPANDNFPAALRPKGHAIIRHRPLVCRWSLSGGSRLACRWRPDISTSSAIDPSATRADERIRRRRPRYAIPEGSA